MFKVGDIIKYKGVPVYYRIFNSEWKGDSNYYSVVNLETFGYIIAFGKNFVDRNFTLVEEESEKKYEITWV